MEIGMDVNSIVNIIEIISVLGGGILWFANIKHSQKQSTDQQTELHNEYKLVTAKIELITAENSKFRTEIEMLKLRVSILEDK